MKKYLLLGLISSLTVSANAETKEKVCVSANSVAKTVMTQRQNGVAMADIYASTAEVKPEESRQFIRAVIRLAYDKPLYSSPEHKKKAITEFQNEIFSRCLKVN